jgi:hypothetical protein
VAIAGVLLAAPAVGLMPAAPAGAAPVAGLDETPPAVGQAPQQAQAGRSGMDITVRGIDDAIKQLNAVEGNPKAQQAAIVLLLIQGAGKKQAPENGRTRYDYHVDVTPDGHILINGLDVSVLVAAANQKR